MAIFNEINKRSGIVVGAVIVALVLFLLTDAFFGKNSIFNRDQDVVGEMDGEKIKLDVYQSQIQRAEQNYMMQTNSAVTENERASIQTTAWNQLLFEIAYKNQFDKLGLNVTEEEWLDIAKGDFIHPMVRQLFGNPEGFNKQMVANFLSNLDKYPAQDQSLWYYVDTHLPEIRLREKYTNLFKKTEYVTKAEAKRQYIAKNEKSDIRFLSVSYYSVPDSTIQVGEEDLLAYLDKHKENYKVDAGRSLDYVVFPVEPTADDTARVLDEVKSLKQEFQNSQNDSLFIQYNSDTPSEIKYVRIGNLPEEMQKQASNLDTNKVYGPFSVNGSYKLIKIEGVKPDSIYSIRASHILFKPASPNPDAKAEARKEAERILNEIKKGASFEAMAKEYGTDATAPKGGDLGWFSEGAMVKPFNDAVFNVGRTGLIPRLVETQFGYHIIKVTEPKMKKLFKIAEITKNVDFSEETKEKVYQQATTFVSGIKDSSEFYKKVKEDKFLSLNSAKNLRKNDRNLNALRNAREVIRWAYNDSEIGDISPVITVGDDFVVALLTDKREKGIAPLRDVRDEITGRVKQEKKGEEILKKLKTTSGTLDERASAYGSAAGVGKADTIDLAADYVQGMGYDPIAVGRVFGLKPNTESEPFEGQSAVVIVEPLNFIPAPEIADYASYKKQLLQQRESREDYDINEVIKEAADVKDERYKFF